LPPLCSSAFPFRHAATTLFRRSRRLPRRNGRRFRTNISAARTSFPTSSPPCRATPSRSYAKQEKDVLTAVTEARAKATAIHVDAGDLTDPVKVKQLQDAQNTLSGALGRLLSVSENYPDLKSNQNFLALQSQLEGTENRISVARKDYIEAVRAYNLSLRTFPSVIWASTFFSGNKPMAEFTATDDAQTTPKVKF
jgi:LemA protein